MQQEGQFKNLDEYVLWLLVTNMVSHPEEVRVVRGTDELGVLLSLYVHPEDMGKVIGVGGNTAKAIRVVLRCIGIKHNARVNMKIVEPEKPVTPGEEPKTSLDDIDQHLGTL